MYCKGHDWVYAKDVFSVENIRDKDQIYIMHNGMGDADYYMIIHKYRTAIVHYNLDIMYGCR